MICVYAEFEVDPTTTASVVVLNVIPNGFNPFTTFVTNAACVFAEKRCSIKYRALTDTYPLGVSCILLGHKLSLGGILPFC